VHFFALFLTGRGAEDGGVTAIHRNTGARAWRAPALRERPLAFHRSLAGYAVTPLRDVPALAAELRVGRVVVKDESGRLGLPSFKVLGAAYATARALSGGTPLPVETLRERLAGNGPRLVAATDGNHGRAVARIGRLIGLGVTVFVPATLTLAARDAIRGEGAEVVALDRPYDEVVRVAAKHVAGLGPDGLLIQDTAWDGYTDIPQWTVDGYATMFDEIDGQLDGVPDLVVVPTGVGSLAQAAVRHYRSGASPGPAVVSVEPERAPAVYASLVRGERISVPTGDTCMTGLNCGTPSANAWPYLSGGLDAAVTVTEARVVRAVHDLESLGLDAGPCGAAALAGARELVRRPELPLPRDATVLLLNTESRTANPLPGEASR
jgi:diaminopropionate ammonia-lyase